MKVEFKVWVAGGRTYSVDVYIEPENTGEKAVLLRSETIRVRGLRNGHLELVTGEFKVRTQFPDEAPSAERPHLPFARRERGWACLLGVRDQDKIIASYGPVLVQFTPRDVHVTD
jgi:hypothetical protein